MIIHKICKQKITFKKIERCYTFGLEPDETEFIYCENCQTRPQYNELIIGYLP